MAAFLLVHGAFQGGWIWDETARRLRGDGHEVHAPTLTGCGYLAGGLRQGVDLHTFIQDVSDYIFLHDLKDVTLVAHSFSGMICAGAAKRVPHLIRRMVFVDAAIPESNTSFADLGGEAFRVMLDNHRSGGWKVRPWPLPAFGVTGEREQWFSARLRDFPEAAFTTPFPGEFEPDGLPAAFIGCTGTVNAMIQGMAARASGLGWPVLSLDSAHSPMTTHPEELAALLSGFGG
ncbi:Alpha/beta hydrolase family protein [Pseudodesulfovibrio hydrargyri]|uniref:Alpha/beta hydrolase family protein n=1 Tax=Pseudodesulfovibrio hydrargyri TaxID=2125990 RepID=A0A1J5N287_9BACT|nr:alpha/beta hydrolase [Pseudodesulfovibrio hydrargyri]OIQ52370.1 Alpha/beta hydrolase family protein [Pseudodesulfovibrio hydrargyri]